MNHFICVTLMIMLSSVTQPTRGDEQLSDESVEQVTRILQQELETEGIPGISAALAVDGKLVWSDGFGLADVENDVLATSKTVYRTASIAKTLTAVALMQLVERGKLDLDRPIHEYFDGFPRKRWPLTARQLLCHQAGIRHYKQADESLLTKHFPDLRSALQLFSLDPLLFEPGTNYHYTTFGYNLAGALVEYVSGQEFATYVGENICQPAGMRSTRDDDHFAIIAHRARGYMRSKSDPSDGIPRSLSALMQPKTLYNAPMHDTSMKIPGGGMVSTAPDLVRFATAINRGQLLSQDSLDLMWTSQETRDGQDTEYGLGWRIMERDGWKVVGHSGGQAGVSTYFMLCPERNTAAAVMCNLYGHKLQSACFQLLDVANATAKRRAGQTAVVLQNVTKVTDYSEVAEKLEKFIQTERVNKDLPAVSIALVDDDQIVWSQGFGKPNEATEQTADGETFYRVGSVSKLFTDMAVMQLVARGQVNLDQEVQHYLPHFRPQNQFDVPITVRQLMSHRSGLVRESPVGNYFDPTEPSLVETVQSLNATELVYRPGTKTKYSNAAVAVAGLLVEQVSGQPFEEYISEHLFRPMAMQHSSFRRSEAIDLRLAEGWMWSPHLAKFAAPEFALGTLPAGNLYSSVDELSNLLITIFGQGRFAGQQVLPAATLTEMLTPESSVSAGARTYGIGFRLGEIEGHRTFGHGGAVYGYSTNLIGLPDEKIGVVAVVALDGGSGFVRRLTDYAIELMLAKRADKPLPIIESTDPLSAGAARKLAGIYESADDEQLELINYGDRLYLNHAHSLNEIRANQRGLVIDDPTTFGPEITQTTGGIAWGDEPWKRIENVRPAACPARWQGLLGEYGWDHNALIIYENRGQLYALIEWFYHYPLTEVSADVFAFPDSGLYHGEKMVFQRDDQGKATKAIAASIVFERRNLGTLEGGVFKIDPVRPIELLRERALSASPPTESRPFLETDFVELRELDPTIKYDIRYAGTNNFMGARFYQSQHAFMQRPAAKAVVRAHQQLREQGYGLLIHDAYRPWYVTKMFWDGTPNELHDFVADPTKGSRHNRGCAVDLTLYDLETGEPVEMVGGYDEMSPRSFPEYPGGDSRQRWHRQLLRTAMEAQGFTVYEFEWWHFDYKDWRRYRINNLRFEELQLTPTE